MLSGRINEALAFLRARSEFDRMPLGLFGASTGAAALCAAADHPGRVGAVVLRGNKRLEVVPGARHLFEEPGALDAVAQLAGAWFANHLANGRLR